MAIGDLTQSWGNIRKHRFLFLFLFCCTALMEMLSGQSQRAGKRGQNSPRTLPFEAATGVPQSRRDSSGGQRERQMPRGKKGSGEEKKKRRKRQSIWLDNSWKSRVPVSIRWDAAVFISRVNHERTKLFNPERECPDLAHQQIETLQRGTF